VAPFGIAGANWERIKYQFIHLLLVTPIPLG